MYVMLEKILAKKSCFGSSKTFLAMLDYVSRAHEIEIRPSSVRRPSVCGIDYL